MGRNPEYIVMRSIVEKEYKNIDSFARFVIKHAGPEMIGRSALGSSNISMGHYRQLFIGGTVPGIILDAQEHFLCHPIPSTPEFTAMVVAVREKVWRDVNDDIKCKEEDEGEEDPEFEREHRRMHDYEFVETILRWAAVYIELMITGK